MTRTTAITIGAAMAITIAALVTWRFTGGDYYTKFEVVEEIEKAIDPNDPLADAGFYDSDTTKETVTREAFRFGLLPTPRGILDKHAFSVVSVTVPAWIAALGVLWLARRRRTI